MIITKHIWQIIQLWFNDFIKHKRSKGGVSMANILAALGLGAANTGSKACVMFWVDEPKMPKSLVK